MRRRISRRQLLQTTSAMALTTSSTKPGFMSAAQSTPERIPESQRPLFRISPQPGSRYALPHTTIAFRGVPPQQLGTIRVMGSLSGPASGIIRQHSDGQGFSWIPDASFFETEVVTVEAEVPLTDTASGTASFVIGEQAPRPAADPVTKEDANSADPNVIHAFKSRPDLSPVKVDITVFDEPRVTDGFIATTPHVPYGQAGATIFDNHGQPVWHYVAENRHHAVYCLKMESYLGQPVLVWSEGSQRRGYGYTHWVIVDQNYEHVGFVQGGHGVDGLDVHDIVLSDSGSAWVFSYHAVWTDDSGTRRNVLECVIQEIDVSTGDVWWEWHSLDHVPLDESFSGRPEDPDTAWDYIHINSIEIDYDGNLLISSRTNHAIYRISTADHTVLWRLGGKNSDFTLASDAVFRWQHDARRLADGTISLFDNVDSTNQANARGMVLELDENRMTATLLREYYRDGGMHSPYQANMQTLANGHVFIGWGSGPRCSEFTPDGEMIYEMRYQAGVSYRGYRVNWQGFPTEPIAYHLEAAPNGTLTCHVSWNGATEVETWRVVTDLGEEVAQAPSESFETSLVGFPIRSYMEIQALDRDGNVLGGRVLNHGG